MHLQVEVITNVSLKQRGLLEKYNYMALRRDKCVFIIICLSFLYRTRRITSVFWELAWPVKTRGSSLRSGRKKELVAKAKVTMQQHYEQWVATTAFVSPLYILTIVLGSLGNGMVIYSYATDQTIHRTFHFLITNLAIADLIMCLLFTPILFIYRVYAKAELISYTPVCEISLFLSMVSISMMYFLFPLLAYHRKDAMLRPQQPRLNLAQTRLVVFFFWFLSTFAGGLMILMARREFGSGDPTPKLYRCLLINQSLDRYAKIFLGYSATLYGLSIAVTAVLYLHIFRTLGTNIEGVNGSADERHVTKLCFWVAIVYTAFWTPFLLVQLGGVFGNYTELHFNLHGCSSGIGVIGSAVNPLLYAIMHPYYRAKLRDLFNRLICRSG